MTWPGALWGYIFDSLVLRQRCRMRRIMEVEAQIRLASRMMTIFRIFCIIRNSKKYLIIVMYYLSVAWNLSLLAGKRLRE